MDKQQRYGEGEFAQRLSETLAIEEPPQLIRHYTNLIYDCGHFVIRLTPNSFRPRDGVIRELHWLLDVGSQSESIVQLFGDEPTNPRQFEFEAEHFTVTLFEKIDGEPINEAQWNSDHFQRLGRLTGWLHRTGMGYVAPSGWELLAWDDAPEESSADYLPDDHRQLARLNRKVAEHVGNLTNSPSSYGPIHFDIHQGNYLLTSDNRLVLFDFENSCLGHHINDIAMVLFYAKTSKLTDASEDFEEQFMKAFWSGYELEYPVPEEEIEQIQWFMLNRAILLCGYLRKIWPGELTEEQTQYVERVDNAVEGMRQRLSL